LSENKYEYEYEFNLLKKSTIKHVSTMLFKLEFHGTDTDTDTDIRDAPIVEFCKRVHDSLHVYTCASLTDILARILARKSARVGQVGRQVGEDRRACPARGKLNGEVAGHADFLATILARKSARMSVSVPWNSSFTAHSTAVNCAVLY